MLFGANDAAGMNTQTQVGGLVYVLSASWSYETVINIEPNRYNANNPQTPITATATPSPTNSPMPTNTPITTPTPSDFSGESDMYLRWYFADETIDGVTYYYDTFSIDLDLIARSNYVRGYYVVYYNDMSNMLYQSYDSNFTTRIEGYAGTDSSPIPHDESGRLFSGKYIIAFYTNDGDLIDSDYCIVTNSYSSGTPEVTVVATPTPRPSVEPSNEQGIGGFVERLYTVALERPSDLAGKNSWINCVRSEGYTGADVARGFLFSPEFIDKSMSDSEFLNILYRVFFDREADTQGKNNWLGLMSRGASKQDVINGFINSVEWANVCLRYGVASGGGASPNITIEPSEEVIDFATRLYSTCLGRNPDQGGLMNWANQLANMQISGSAAAHGFFFSAEFTGSGISDSEYVKRLYRTFMGREYDQGGYDTWMGVLNSGGTREQVFQGFAGSQEWAGICAEYGILK